MSMPPEPRLQHIPRFTIMSTPSSAFNEDVQRNLRELRKTKLSAEELYATAQVTLQSIKAVDARTLADPEANAPNFLVLAMAVYARDDLKDVLLAGAIDGMRRAALYPFESFGRNS